MKRGENDFRPHTGRSRDAGKASARTSVKLAVQVQRAASKAGYTRSRSYGAKTGGRTARSGRGRRALASLRHSASSRRVTVLGRIVRHRGAHFRSAPLGRHISYLERDGVTRDGRDASMFDHAGEAADRNAFAERCTPDRHHFRFIVSPEDAVDLSDLRAFTREFMTDLARDFDTKLDWIAVDHWNTDNPHIHILLRGRADDGTDLVIDRGYISDGMRLRAEQRVTLELGPRNAREIEAALQREVDAERWTSLDHALESRARDAAGLIDLRPDRCADGLEDHLLRGRIATLNAMGLATEMTSGIWTIHEEAKPTLHELAHRNDIIKTMHRAMGSQSRRRHPGSFVLHDAHTEAPIVGRLVERGLHDELSGSAYAIVDAVDGRVHHVRFDDLTMTGDAHKGAIVELRRWGDAEGIVRQALATRSDYPLDAQINASGATWLDRQLVANGRTAAGIGFGEEVNNALEARAQVLAERKLAHRIKGRWSFASNMIETLRTQELADAGRALCAQTGLDHRPTAPGDAIMGRYRERIQLASGRFAMIDDGMGFQLVPWRPALDQRLGQQVAGTLSPAGSVEWTYGRAKGISI